MTIYFRLLLCLLLYSNTAAMATNIVPASIAVDSIPSGTAAVAEPGHTAAKVAITAAGISLGATLVYAMFISVQAYPAILLVAVLAMFVGAVMGFAALLLTKRKTQSRKRAVAALLISIVLFCVGVWQAGKALDQGQ